MKTTITRTELKQLLSTQKPLMVIDVRSKEEYNEKHIPFAGNLNIEIIEAGNFVPEPDKIIVTACGKGGGRSEKAAEYFRNHSSNEVYFLEGGTFGWFNESGK